MRLRTVTALLVVAGLCGACGWDGENKHRLQVLRADPLLRCDVPGTTPWLTLDMAGTTHGIGFGGTSPTDVDRVLHLKDPPRLVTRHLLACALAAGWQPKLEQRLPSGTVVIGGSKQLEHSWSATLSIFIGEHVFREQPAVVLGMQTDAV